jgi:hypothetical protein
VTTEQYQAVRHALLTAEIDNKVLARTTPYAWQRDFCARNLAELDQAYAALDSVWMNDEKEAAA